MNLLLLAAAVLILFSLISIVAAVAFIRGLHLPKSRHEGRITLILPIAGTCTSLPRLIDKLNAQSVQPHRLIIAVESTADPAYRYAQEAICSAQFFVEIVVAGLASKCAQKCWNQIAALQCLDGRDDAIILLDADIDPPPWWLSMLASPILAGKADIVTGYRWHLTKHLAPAQHIIAAIDRGIAMLPSLPSARLVWGGSIALSTSALAALNLPTLLSNVLSDDCTIGDQAATLGLRVLTRRLLRVPTPPHENFSQAWRFGRRQYQIIRIYRPGLWTLAFGTISIRLLAWGIILTNLGKTPVAMFALLLLACLSLTTVGLQQQAAGRLGFRDDIPSNFGQIACALFKPIIDLFHWTVIFTSWWSHSLSWGHVRYQISAANHVLVTNRKPWSTMENLDDKHQLPSNCHHDR